MSNKQSIGTLISSSAKKLQKENVALRGEIQKALNMRDELSKENAKLFIDNSLLKKRVSFIEETIGKIKSKNTGLPSEILDIEIMCDFILSEEETI